jgi:hypothetical protein
MNGTGLRKRYLLDKLVFLVVVMFSVGFSGTSEGSEKAPHSPEKAIKLGERMYREGILPSGEPMQAFVKGDVFVSGTSFSCVSCHLKSGIGSVEGGVLTPPTNGITLYKPFEQLYKGYTQTYFPITPRRPAYTDKSLANVIRSGELPAGGYINDVMPRYVLEDDEMGMLIAYLKSLSEQFSSGVTDTSINLATVITEDVPLETRNAMLLPLQIYINIKNGQSQFIKTPQGSRARRMSENMLVSKEMSSRKLVLSQWLLKGSPETWRSQLEEYYRKEPVFALVGGISSQDWQPIHQFSEDNKIPCLLPQTDFPVISTTDWYTLYPSKGYYQEGEAAARYLNSRENSLTDKPVVQVVRDSREGKALAEGFEKTWQETGHRASILVTLKNGEKITGTFIEQLLINEKPATIVLWDGPDVSSALELLATARNKPERVFVSLRYLGKNIRIVPEGAREFTFITYPYSFALQLTGTAMGKILVEDDSKWNISLKDALKHDNVTNAKQLSDSTTQLLTMALMDMKGYYYRDNFFDVIGMVPDQHSQLFGRISFGAGQRYASKGCYIVQLTKGPNPEVVRKSGWVTY